MSVAWSAPEAASRRPSRSSRFQSAVLPVDRLTLEDRKILRDRTFSAVRTLRIRARERLRQMGIDPGGID